MDVDRLLNSQIGVKLAYFLARTTPGWLGYSLARLVALWLSSRRNSERVRAVRSNQWIVAGGIKSNELLDKRVQMVFQNSARSIYELYHNLQNLVEIDQMFAIEPSFQAILERPEFGERGLVLAGLHMMGFDLGLRWLCNDKIKPLVLTLPDTEDGRRLEFEMRQKTGMNLVPGSVNGLRQAIRYLKQGGLVITGIDRPVPDCDPRPRFFGRPSSLPAHHVYLALKAQAPVMVVVSRLEDDGKYHLFASPSIEMKRYSNRAEELLFNCERVLAVAEDFIQQAPQQWMISLPVWPEMASQLPGSSRTPGN